LPFAPFRLLCHQKWNRYFDLASMLPEGFEVPAGADVEISRSGDRVTIQLRVFPQLIESHPFRANSRHLELRTGVLYYVDIVW
jgi:hypothetical protein